MIIAVDGPAASGKGTLARLIARHLNFHYLDTGSLYRAVARDCRDKGFRAADPWAAVAVARGLDPKSLDDEGLRDPGVGEAASIVAQLPEVRAALLNYQRAFARQQPGAVLDGRDIGTVVCPYADIKIFVDATAEVRADRRHRELVARGEDVTYARILDLIQRRDARDSGRANAPMRRADDAHLLDTTDKDIDAAYAAASDVIKRMIGR